MQQQVFADDKIECPRCRTYNSAVASRCIACNSELQKKSQFDSFIWRKSQSLNRSPNANEVAQRFSGTLHVAKLWEKVIQNYNQESFHQDFIMACYRSDCLQYAAQKYTRILNSSPSEGIASKMQTQVLGLANKLNIRVPKDEPIAPKTKFPIMISVMGGILVSVGLLVPAANNLIGLGASFLLLSAGLAFYLKK